MPISLSPVTHLFSYLLSPRPSLDCLSNDILVDCVFLYLNIKDILRLRQVSFGLNSARSALTYFRGMHRSADYSIT